MDIRRVETSLRDAWLEEEPNNHQDLTPVVRFRCVYSSILGEHLDPSRASQGLTPLQYSYPILQDFPLINLGAGRYTVDSGSAELAHF